MKNLLTISQNEFTVVIKQLTFSQIKRLLEGIRNFISDRAMSENQLHDILRKETKLWHELQERGILNDKTNPEFQAWINKFRKKRVY